MYVYIGMFICVAVFAHHASALQPKGALGQRAPGSTSQGRQLSPDEGNRVTRQWPVMPVDYQKHHFCRSCLEGLVYVCMCMHLYIYIYICIHIYIYIYPPP